MAPGPALAGPSSFANIRLGASEVTLYRQDNLAMIPWEGP